MVPPTSADRSGNSATSQRAAGDPVHGTSEGVPADGRADLLHSLLREFPDLPMRVVTDAVDEAWTDVESVRTAPTFWLTYVDLLAREELGRERLHRREPRTRPTVPAPSGA